MAHKERKITIEIEGERPKVMYFTPATDEQLIIKEILIDECYDFDFNKDDVVLNIGGNIGAFEVTYADRVSDIITYEPDEECFKKLKRHCELNGINNVIGRNRAIGIESGFMPFTDKELKGHNGYDPDGDRIVVCDDINKVVEEFQPNKIKCDIEGYEYELFENFKIPDYVDEIWLETHTYNFELSFKHEKLVDKLEEIGFIVEEIHNDIEDRTFLVHAKRQRINN